MGLTSTILFFGFGICAVVFVYFGIPLIYAKWLRLFLKLKTSKSNTLVLTYDDGPGNRLTPAILNILAENKTTATFFILGKNIAGREEIVRQIAKQGHEICSHGHDHLHYWKVSPIRAIQDIKSGWRRIDAVLGTSRTKYPFRPPYGKLNIICLLYLLIRNVPIIYWTLDMRDTWHEVPLDYNRMASMVEKVGSAVSLAHDFDRCDDSIDQFIIESTRSVLRMAKEKNMKILTISELLVS